MTAKEAQSEAPNVETLEEILIQVNCWCLHDRGCTIIEEQQKAIAKINRLIVQARIDESTPNASDDGKHTRVHVPQRNHINGTEYDKGWNDCWNAFWTARWKRVAELSNNLSKGGGDEANGA